MGAQGRGGLYISLPVLVLFGVLSLWGREGLAATAKPSTYVGSLQCRACHDKIYATWRKTIHAQAIQDVNQNPRAVQGDWSQFAEESPSARMSKGFLYSGQGFTPSQVQFDWTIFSSRAFSWAGCLRYRKYALFASSSRRMP